jgi:hypothetical protein
MHRSISDSLTSRLRTASVRAAILLSAGLTVTLFPATTPTARAQTIAAPFNGSYSIIFDATVAGVSTPYGGVNFLNANTMVLGGAANGTTADIFTIPVIRGVGNHITGFGAPTSLADAFGGSLVNPSGGIDGGLVFAPNGTILYTSFSDNSLGQIAPARFRPGGSGTPNRIDSLSPTVGDSVGTLQFVPAGFGAASGQLKVASFSFGDWHNLTLTDDGTGNGTFDIAIGPTLVTTPGGPEGIVYVLAGNPQFAVNSVVVSEFSSNRVSAYDVDANANPIVGTRRDFITGLSGAEGGVTDPVTGDFIFSTFGGGNRIVIVSGFSAPVSNAAPEPGTIALLALAGLPLAGVAMRRRRIV